MNFDEALSYLLSLGHETLAMKLGLTNTELLLEKLGNPQRTYPAVQIAGTNGKGSTAVMLDSICRAAGLRTGLFTSPHLVRITERAKIGGQEVSQSDFARWALTVREAVGQLLDNGSLAAPPTFFEQVTAIALLAFAEAKVDLAILETGLGGRLDSTTVAGAETIAITPIALDHQEYLGETLAQIAAEKAAIIRPGVQAVVAPQPAAVRAVIFKRCQDCGVTPQIDDWAATIVGATDDGRFRVVFETDRDRYDEVTLGLRGRHQILNAGVAIRLAESLLEGGFQIPRAIIQGLAEAKHAGRLELRSETPALLFDGAHNPSGAQALRDYLDEFVKIPVTMVFGAMGDKDLKSMAAILFPAAEHLILTQPDTSRAASPALLKSMTVGLDSSRISVTRNIEEALRQASRVTQADEMTCVTGSLYLVGEALSIFDQSASSLGGGGLL